MEDILKQVYNACSPFQPASAEFYLDCAKARGDGALSKDFTRALSLNTGDYLTYLLSGHIGCGKSSELAELQRQLENPKAKERYFTVLVDTSEYLDIFNATSTDILLAVVTELAAQLRERANVDVRQGTAKKFWEGFTDFLNSEVKIGPLEVGANVGIPVIGATEVKTTLELVKADPDARDKVRAHYAPRLSSIREATNDFLAEARLGVKKLPVKPGETPYKDIVLILDNLEKIANTTGDAVAAQRELFIENAPQLTGLKAHVIYTIPLGLARAEANPLMQRYAAAPFVLPMVKVRRRNKERYEPGLKFLREILEKRLAGHSLEQVFEPRALDFLLFYSGGHLRSLMRFVRNACIETTEIPISLQAARKAVQDDLRTYATLPDRFWAKLVAVDLDSKQHMPADDDDYIKMLENLSILEYNNGDGGEDEVPEDDFSLEDNEIVSWYAVNPIITQMSLFKAEREKQLAQKQAGEGQSRE